MEIKIDDDIFHEAWGIYKDQEDCRYCKGTGWLTSVESGERFGCMYCNNGKVGDGEWKVFMEDYSERSFVDRVHLCEEGVCGYDVVLEIYPVDYEGSRDGTVEYERKSIKHDCLFKTEEEALKEAHKRNNLHV